jgi:hypothetical protein
MCLWVAFRNHLEAIGHAVRFKEHVSSYWPSSPNVVLNIRAFSENTKHTQLYCDHASVYVLMVGSVALLSAPAQAMSKRVCYSVD